MRLLEIVHGGNEVLRLVFDAQREHLKKHFGLRTISIEGMKKETATQLVKKNIIDFQPVGLLLRGIYGLPAVALTGTKIPLVVDHCTPAELGKTSPLREHLHTVRRVICYSSKAENDVREAGLGKVTVLSGPFLPVVDCPLPENLGVAILDTCPGARAVLDHVRNMRASKGWKFDIVSTMVASGVIHVDSAPEAVERAHLVVGVYDEMDYGQPHDAAILALSFGRALAASRTSAFGVLPYPVGSYITTPTYATGAASAAVDIFMRSPGPFLSWPAKVKSDPAEVPNLVKKLVAP